jgi:hypothetical protein
LLLLAAPAAAQVQIVCGPTPTKHSKAVFDHRTARELQRWPCVLTNAGAAPASVSEAAVQGWMMRRGVVALSSSTIRIGAAEIKRRGKWATLGRVMTHAALVATALAAGDVIQVGPAWGAAFGFGALQLPQLGERLAARDPDPDIFEQLAIRGELAIAPGASVEVSMFAVPVQDAQTIEGFLDVGPLANAVSREPLAVSRAEIPIPAASTDCGELWASVNAPMRWACFREEDAKVRIGIQEAELR